MPSGFEAGVMLVGRDGHLALGDQLTDLLDGAVLLLGHRLHLGRDDALAGGIHLCGVSLHGCKSSENTLSYLSCTASGTPCIQFSTPDAAQRCGPAGRSLGPSRAARSARRSGRPWPGRSASASAKPLARLAAMALDRVQPVPWVLGLSTRCPGNQSSCPSRSARRSSASVSLWPPFSRTAQP